MHLSETYISGEFKEVPPYEFFTYIEEIKGKLRPWAPEWQINQLSSEINNLPTTIYHLQRVDFTKGKDQTWDVRLYEWPFALEQGVGDQKKYSLYSQYPIQMPGYPTYRK